MSGLPPELKAMNEAMNMVFGPIASHESSVGKTYWEIRSEICLKIEDEIVKANLSPEEASDMLAAIQVSVEKGWKLKEGVDQARKKFEQALCDAEEKT